MTTVSEPPQSVTNALQNALDYTSHDIRIAVWPDALGGRNPYLRLFYGALQRQSNSVVFPLEVNDAWLGRNASQIDAIHLHWPEALWRRDKGGLLANAHGLLGFRRFLRLANRLGIKVIWTVHNLRHHEGGNLYDWLGYRMLARAADLVICHSRDAKAAITGAWRPRQCVVMPHGNYDDAYPKPAARTDVLCSLGLSPVLPTFCCVGLIRGYKNFELAAKAVSRCRENVQLIIAGQVFPEYDPGQLRALSARNPRIRLLEQSLSDQQFADIVAASDGMILPYQEITGSGALLAAWTFGTGVVASDLAYFREAAEHEPLAIELFPVDDESALGAAMERYLLVDSDTRRAAVRQLSDSLSWDRVIEPVAEVMGQWRLQDRAPAGNPANRVRP